MTNDAKVKAVAWGIGLPVTLIAMWAGWREDPRVLTPRAAAVSQKTAEQRSDELRLAVMGTLYLDQIDGEFDRDRIRIRGRVKNTGTMPVEFVKVEAAITDEAGAVVGREWTYATHSVLYPGESSEFRISGHRPGGARSFALHVVDARPASRE